MSFCSWLFGGTGGPARGLGYGAQTKIISGPIQSLGSRLYEVVRVLQVPFSVWIMRYNTYSSKHAPCFANSLSQLSPPSLATQKLVYDQSILT